MTIRYYLRSFKDIHANLRNCRLLHYVQGQSPENRVREYFYYVDHQGQVSLCYSQWLIGYIRYYCRKAEDFYDVINLVRKLFL